MAQWSRTPPGALEAATKPEPRPAQNVSFWLGADIQRESAERPVLTLSGHSAEYAVQQVGTENQGFAYTFK